MYRIKVDASIPLDIHTDGEAADRLVAAMRKGLEDFIRGNKEVASGHTTTFSVELHKDFYR